MQFSNIASYGLCLPALVSAAALPTIRNRQATTNFEIIAVRSGSPIHLNSFQAHDNHLWLGGAQTVTACPTDGSVDCSAYSNTTLFTGPYGSAVTINMDVAVPGGQTLFVAADGSVQYTKPGESVPADGAADVWTFDPPGSSSSNQFGSLSNADTSKVLLACPLTSVKTQGPWEIFVGPAGAVVPSGNTADCYTMGALTQTETGAGAYEYA